MRHLTLVLVLISVLCCRDASAFDKPEFPRLAANWLGNQNYQDPVIQRQLARSHVATIYVWDGWEQTKGASLESVIKNIKSMNSETLVFNYILNEAIPVNQGATRELVDKVNAMKWWVYPAGTSGSAVPSFWSSEYLTVNNTLHAPADSTGDRWVDWHAKWAHRKFAVPNPSLDGFFLDNVFYRPRVDGDWNRDGAVDKASNLTVGNWQREGLARHFDVMRQLMPGKFQIGNIAEWGYSGIPLSPLEGKVNGGVMEAIIGLSWSVESWGTWNDMMAHYRKTMSVVAEPKLVLFHQVGDPRDYRGFRYGFASCLMDDGYFAFNSSAAYSDSPEFDEYQVELGEAMQSPRTGAWQSGVFRRDFTNGIVLVNPKGNGPRTVQLEADFNRIRGTQDPSVNNGQVTRSVTLQDRDGLILLREDVLAVPNPPASVVAK